MGQNLDLECATCGSNIPQSKDDEKLITKSLGVLQENGVYAFFLYLASQGDEVADRIAEKTFSLLESNINSLKVKGGMLSLIRDKLDKDLNSLLFAKELLERTLVYARYHAKAIVANTKTDEVKE